LFFDFEWSAHFNRPSKPWTLLAVEHLIRQYQGHAGLVLGGKLLACGCQFFQNCFADYFCCFSMLRRKINKTMTLITILSVSICEHKWPG
jgi:hypothetical protein